MRKSFEPQLTKNKFKSLWDYNEVPQGTKLFYKNDQTKVFWEYTVYHLVDVNENGLLVKDTNGIESTLSASSPLYVMIS